MTYNEKMTLMARIGFAARGLVYIMVGWLALDVAANGGETTDNQGALGTLANAPLGHALLAICAIGFAGYAIWRLTEAITDPENRSRTIKGKFERAGYAFSGLTHVGLATAAARLALKQTRAQHGSPGDASAESWSAWLLTQCCSYSLASHCSQSPGRKRSRLIRRALPNWMAMSPPPIMSAGSGGWAMPLAH